MGITGSLGLSPKDGNDVVSFTFYLVVLPFAIFLLNSFDLQIQSTASDGRHTPREIVAMAKTQGVLVIALTDHDTVSGVAEAVETGKELEVRVIPGIETSVEEHDAHLLGYGIDIANGALLTELEKARVSRIEGAKQMVKNLKAAGFVIEWNEVIEEAKGPTVARPHIARAALKHPENKEKLGGAENVHDFIDQHLGDTSPHYVRRAHILAKDAIALIHGAGGVAVWSHPAIHFQDDPEGLEEFLRKLMEWGIDGIEVFNPSHTEDDMELLEGLAAKYGLLRTAGSDFHEAGDHPAGDRGLHSARAVGDYETYGFSLDRIIERLDEEIRKRQKH